VLNFLGQSHRTQKGESIACAVASHCKVDGKSKRELEFCLAWNMPQVSWPLYHLSLGCICWKTTTIW